MIIIRANHDTLTNYLFVWSGCCISEAEKRNFKVNKLEGPDISFESFEKRINKVKPKFIFFNGHGSDTAFYNNEQNEFCNLSSVHVFKNTVVFARACNCLKKLGAAAIKSGKGDAFVGYSERFWVARLHDMASRPLKDPVTKHAMVASNLVAEQLIKGKTVKEAVEKSHEYSKRAVRELIYSADPLASSALAAIIRNDSALGFEGNPDATIA